MPEDRVIEPEVVESEVTDLAEMATGIMPSIRDEDIAAVVAAVQKQADAVVAIKAALFRLCSPRDFVDMGGEPYLTEDGAVKLIGPLQVEMEMMEGERINHDDGTYEYKFAGRARCGTLATGWVPIVGSRWSGDKFFSSQTGPLDPGDVRKAAYTSFRALAVKTSAGLGGITWAQVNPGNDQNVDQSKVTGFEFDNSGQHARAADCGNTALIKEHHTLSTAGKNRGKEYSGSVTRLMVKTGPKKDGSTYIKTEITLQTDSGAIQMSTFDTKVGGVLLGALDNEIPVAVCATQDGKYLTIHGAKHASEEA